MMRTMKRNDGIIHNEESDRGDALSDAHARINPWYAIDEGQGGGGDIADEAEDGTSGSQND